MGTGNPMTSLPTIPATVERRPLGRSALRVTPLGLGCWQFSQAEGLVGRFWPRLPTATTRDIVAAALRGGINWFDTAEVYGWGRSEEGLADALAQVHHPRSDLVIADKWWPLLRRARNIARTFPERTACLGGLGIDLYQLHNPYSWSAWKRQMEEMRVLLEDKKIGAVGVSNFGVRAMRQCHRWLGDRYGLASNQVKFSLLDRRIERNGVLTAARELGITIIAYSPLEQGILSGKFHERPDLLAKAGPRRYRRPFKRAALETSAPLIAALRHVGENHGRTAAQVALRWVVQVHGETVVAIPGATTPRHVDDNVGAMTFVLSGDEVEELAALSLRSGALK
jgi:aryl-alcohol dehydrogenase-like predicted oxidoreductase